MKKRLLITGASGFIGSNFIQRSGQLKKYKVTAVYNSAKPLFNSNEIKYVKADLEDYDSCIGVCKNIDYILNFSGVMLTTAARKMDHLKGIKSNISMHLNMINAAKNTAVEKYIWMSSTTGYPVIPRPAKEIDFNTGIVPDRYFPIGEMYRFIENFANYYLTKERVLVTLRPTGVYGEYDDFNPLTAHVLPTLILKLFNGTSQNEFFADKTETRDWIYVGDFIDAVDRVLSKVDKNMCFNIGYGQPVSMYELHRCVLSTFRKQEDFLLSERIFDNGRSIDRNIDCSLSVRELGFYGKTSLSDGIKKTVSWLRRNPNG